MEPGFVSVDDPESKINELKDLISRVEMLNSIGVALSATKDLDQLLTQILEGAQELTRADAGTLYSVTEKGELCFELVRTLSRGFCWGGKGLPKVPFPHIPIYEDGRPNERLISAYAAAYQKTIRVEDAYQTTEFDWSGTREFDKKTGYRSQSFLTVPILDVDGKTIGVLQLINAIHPESGEVIPFSDEAQGLVESLASQAGIAMENQRLIKGYAAMFEALVAVLGEAIDSLCPVTAGHCQRVPVLADLIAQALNETDSGPYAEVEFDSKELEELHLAALLHDCGKVTVPTHLMNKGTKLELLSDQIHLIDTRFEVLIRDLEIRRLKGELGEEAYEDSLHSILDDREFLRQLNLGETPVNREALDRLTFISAYTWKGPSGHVEPFLSKVERENLAIVKGTLNTEERKVVEAHVAASMRMLAQIPFPHHLEHVASIAGAHHERMDGKGYPHGLRGEDIPLAGRVLTLADVVDALSDTERPYRSHLNAEDLHVVLREMADSGHLDPELIKIFEERDVLKRYQAAKKVKSRLG